MAEALSEAGVAREDGPVAVGAQVLDTLTSGMYSQPLMVLREYVQNAADAIDEAVDTGLLGADQGRIAVTLNGRERCLVVEDNGTGIPSGDVLGCLCSIGVSRKLHKERRGFRGIGRMGGMAYCDRLRFETRSDGSEPVSVIEWDCRLLRKLLSEKAQHIDARRMLAQVLSAHARAGEPTEPSHFLRVSMVGVHRFHSGELMSAPAVLRHLSEVAPVPFDQSRFSFGSQVAEFLQDVPGYRTYRIELNGRPVYRPHSRTVGLSAHTVTEISDVELFRLPGREGEEVGRGWYATMPLSCALPKSVWMRGIQVRQGNIRIGDEYWMQEFCTERRFATWHVGEIHVGRQLKPNARRDGFEHSSEYEALLEQLQLLGRHLSHLCRSSSTARARSAEAARIVGRLKAISAPGIYIDEAHRHALQREMHDLCARLEHYCSERVTSGNEPSSGLSSCPRPKADSAVIHVSEALDGRLLRNIDPKALVAEVLSRLSTSDCGLSALPPAVLAEALGPYLRKTLRST